MEQEYRRKRWLLEQPKKGKYPAEKLHRCHSFSGALHDQTDIAFARVTLHYSAQRTRINIHSYFYPSLEQSLEGEKDLVLG